MIIQSRNLLHQTAPKAFLSYPEVSGTNVLRWSNPNGFSASWAVQIGETGEEQTEVMLLGASTPSGTAGTLTANTLYEHPSNTPIYGIKFNKVVFERATAGTTGTATPMTSGTIDYMADSQYTIFDDTSGSSTYGYRTYFRSSVLAVNSTESDWITSAGFTFYALASLRQRIKDKLWNPGFIKNDTIIDNWINEWKDEMTNSVIAINQSYAMGTVDIPFGTNGLGTVTTTDFKQVKRLWVTTNSVDYYNSTKMEVQNIFPNQSFNSTHPYHAWHGDSVFEINPSDTAGTARLEFYRFGTTLVNDTDELPLPFRPYTKSFVNYGLSQALFKDQKSELSNAKLSEAIADRSSFITQSTPRDKSGPTYVTIVEAVSGEGAY